MMPQEGGCLCGGVRYRITAAPEGVGYCHCRMCQRSAGAPVLVWASVPGEAFAWTRGRPRAYRSSAKAERLFCPDCGCQLAFVADDEPGRIELTVPTLDDPTIARPAHHIWTSSRLPWFETADALPRHAEERTVKAQG